MLNKLVCHTAAFSNVFVKLSDYGFVFSINEEWKKETSIS